MGAMRKVGPRHILVSAEYAVMHDRLQNKINNCPSGSYVEVPYPFSVKDFTWPAGESAKGSQTCRTG